jgi:ribonuclease HI
MDDSGAHGQVVAEGYGYLGFSVSNNQAEYHGLIGGLQFVKDEWNVDGLYIRDDSQIVINHGRRVCSQERASF